MIWWKVAVSVQKKNSARRKVIIWRHFSRHTCCQGIGCFIFKNFTARKRSLRRLCFHRCLTVHRGWGCPGPGPEGVYPSMHWGRHPLPHQTATAADGTHPTGMHSRFKHISFRWLGKESPIDWISGFQLNFFSYFRSHPTSFMSLGSSETFSVLSIFYFLTWLPIF